MVPHHIAIIMDGNNRWAKRRNLPGVAGHRAGVEAIRSVLRACNKHGIKVLTLFAFSSENWGRPRAEVRNLMALFSRYLRNETRELHKDGIRIRFIGKRDRFSPRQRKLMEYAETLTADRPPALIPAIIATPEGGRLSLIGTEARITFNSWLRTVGSRAASCDSSTMAPVRSR